MRGLNRVWGHEDVRQSLARASDSRQLPGSLLLHGPAGIGKQRLGLWLAQRLVCDEPGGVEPCGACQSCKLALRLEHPDVHWFFPIARPKSSGSADKLGEALEEARGAELAARREDPFRVRTPGDPVGYYMATIQTVRRLSGSRPAMGQRSVFLIGDAGLLVPQESSPEAANALLKLLEEPPPSAVFILTAADPDSLLPTIRSRLLGVRVRPLPAADVHRFLVEERGVAAADADRVARLAQGAIGRALGYLPDGDEPGPLDAVRIQAREFLAAAASGQAARRLTLAHATAPAAARGVFSDVLDQLVLWLRDVAAVASGAETAVLNSDALPFLQEVGQRLPNAGSGVPNAVRAVERSRELAAGNVNPQLLTASLLHSIHQALAHGH